jgi:hypothetical protein
MHVLLLLEVEGLQWFHECATCVSHFAHVLRVRTLLSHDSKAGMCCG